MVSPVQSSGISALLRSLPKALSATNEPRTDIVVSDVTNVSSKALTSVSAVSGNRVLPRGSLVDLFV